MKKDKKFFHGHARLAEVRAELWDTQQEAADFFGVTRVTWGQYERGNATPSADVLAGLVQQDADVIYVLTGQHASASPMPDAVERVLLNSYRMCKPDAQAKLIQAAALLSADLPITEVTQGSSVGGTHTSSGAGAVHMGQVSGVGVRTGKSKK